ncbi:unnamed protein product [Amoebophrya sp. A120]|nr:unnamed protein product [Amoebophrya sp. A120]|eukprot:GSA120T00004284001.1
MYNGNGNNDERSWYSYFIDLPSLRVWIKIRASCSGACSSCALQLSTFVCTSKMVALRLQFHQSLLKSGARASSFNPTPEAPVVAVCSSLQQRQCGSASRRMSSIRNHSTYPSYKYQSCRRPVALSTTSFPLFLRASAAINSSSRCCTGRTSVCSEAHQHFVSLSNRTLFTNRACSSRLFGATTAHQLQKSCLFSTTIRIPPDKKNRLRRSVHFVPGDSEKFLQKCLSLNADTLVLDLEDSVLLPNKQRGRQLVQDFLQKNIDARRTSSSSLVSSLSAHGKGEGSGSSLPHPEILVRINPLDSEFWHDDLRAAQLADGFMLPKISSKQDLDLLENSGLLRPDHVLLPIATETPLAVLNLQEIAAGSDRIAAITWGCEDLSAAIGATSTRTSAVETINMGAVSSKNPSTTSSTSSYLPVFQNVRTQCLLAAKAANIQAIDGVFTDVKDGSGFAHETTEAKQMGFDGKLSLHPLQIEQLTKLFSPTSMEMQEAEEIVALFESAEATKGAVVYKNQMVDLPHYTRAKKILQRGKQSGVEISGRAEDPAPKSTTVSMKNEGRAKINDKPTEPEQAALKRKPPEPVYHGKFLEELRVGLKIPHALTRTVTEADNVFFTCLTLNPAPIHLDHTLAAKSSEFGGKPLFNSMFTLALLVGMTVLETTHGTTIANLGFSKVVFPKPVFPLDTLCAETVVLENRESKSRPGQGIVTLEHTMFNQHGDVVCTCVRQALMKCKPKPKPS